MPLSGTGIHGLISKTSPKITQTPGSTFKVRHNIQSQAIRKSDLQTGAEVHTRKKDVGTPKSEYWENPWWKDLFPDVSLLPVDFLSKHSCPQFKEIPQSELGPDIHSGSSFTSVCINTAIYLPWLVSQCLKAGVVFKRAVFSHISEAAAPGVHHSGSRADLIINCTGLSASKLGGVEDPTVTPIRGQIVVVRNDPKAIFSISGCDDGPEEGAYVMSRAAGGGTVLGGCTQKGKWESQFDPNLAIRIMTRAVALCPQLTGGKGIEHLDVIRHGVGLRPSRENGTRIEKEKIDGLWIVHNYGHGGAGYQSSYGCSQVAVKLVEEAFRGSAQKL